MASPTPEIAVPALLTTGALVAYFGHDVTFWVVVLSVTGFKMVTSDPVLDKDGDQLTGRQRWRQWFISFLGGVLPPFLLTKIIAEAFAVASFGMEILIAFGLALVGEGFMRWAARQSHNPEGFIVTVLKIWRGK